MLYKGGEHIKYTEQDRLTDFEWFKSIYYDLYKKNGHKYYSIRNKTILGMYDNQGEALDTTLKLIHLELFSYRNVMEMNLGIQPERLYPCGCNLYNLKLQRLI